jgi:hypothetical protein
MYAISAHHGDCPDTRYEAVRSSSPSQPNGMEIVIPFVPESCDFPWNRLISATDLRVTPKDRSPFSGLRHRVWVRGLIGLDVHVRIENPCALSLAAPREPWRYDISICLYTGHFQLSTSHVYCPELSSCKSFFYSASIQSLDSCKHAIRGISVIVCE